MWVGADEPNAAEVLQPAWVCRTSSKRCFGIRDREPAYSPGALGTSYGDAAQNGGGGRADMGGLTGSSRSTTSAATTAQAGATIAKLMAALAAHGSRRPSCRTRHVTLAGAIE